MHDLFDAKRLALRRHVAPEACLQSLLISDSAWRLTCGSWPAGSKALTMHVDAKLTLISGKA
jgi:hypothetical protein